MLAILVWGGPVATTHAAGSYEVSTCNYAPDAVNNSWTWTSSEPAKYAQHANCPDLTAGSKDQEGGLATTDALGLSSGAASGTSAGWRFAAPAGTTITAISYERDIGHRFDGFNDWSPALRADGALVADETCLDTVENGETCTVGGPPGTEGKPTAIRDLSAHELSIGIACQAPTGDECVTGATEHSTWAAMYGATVTISDPTPPTLGEPSGPLWSANEPGQPHKGTESVDVDAQDAGGGVASISLSVDGQPAATYTAPCDFTQAKPCPESTGTQTLTLSTAQIADGQHTLELMAEDAAGNRSMIATTEIAVGNGPPSSGVAASPVVPTAEAPQTGGGPGAKNGPMPTTPMLHISERLHRHELVVIVNGDSTSTLRIAFTGRIGGKVVASGAKTLQLEHGRVVARFHLGSRTAARALLRVSAKAEHGRTVVSELKRRYHRA